MPTDDIKNPIFNKFDIHQLVAKENMQLEYFLNYPKDKTKSTSTNCHHTAKRKYDTVACFIIRKGNVHCLSL